MKKIILILPMLLFLSCAAKEKRQIASYGNTNQVILKDTSSTGPAHALRKYLEVTFDAKKTSATQTQVTFDFDDLTLVKSEKDKTYSILGYNNKPLLSCKPDTCLVATAFTISGNNDLITFHSWIGGIMSNLMGPYPQERKGTETTIPGAQGLTLLCPSISYKGYCTDTEQGGATLQLKNIEDPITVSFP